MYKHSVELDVSRCTGCTTCLRHCPTEAIRIRDGHAVINEDRCIDCGECIRVCPSNAKKAMCSKFEHYASECGNEKKNKNQKNGEEANLAENKDSDDDVSFMVTLTDETAESMEWYFDTGCSNHMTGNRNILTDFDNCLNTKIKLANSKSIDAKGIGNVVIQRKNGRK